MTDQPLSGRHIAVLLGGPSSEREVSLVSGRACAEALERLGARVTRIDPGKDVAQALTAAYARLGTVAIAGNQNAFYLSLQVGF